MAGATLQFDISSINRLEARLQKLSEVDYDDLKDNLGSEAESQVRRRLSDEKESPEGEPWAEWSSSYAETRHGGHSLLEGEGDLIDSIEHQVNGDEIEVGSNLVYAAIQNFGADKGEFNGSPWGDIPARPWLGFSDENLADLEALTDDWVDMQLETLQ